MISTKWIWLALPIALALALVGCDALEDDDDGGGDDVIVIGQSGDQYTLNGQTWEESCREVDGNGFVSVLMLEKGKVSFTDYTYSDAGAVCMSDETVDDEGTAKVKMIGDEEVTGWSDGTVVGGPPAAGDGMTTLDNPPTATVWEVTIDGQSFRTAFFMDDTDPDNLIMYGGTEEPAGCEPAPADEDCLRSDVGFTRID